MLLICSLVLRQILFYFYLFIYVLPVLASVLQSFCLSPTCAEITGVYHRSHTDNLSALNTRIFKLTHL